MTDTEYSYQMRVVVHDPRGKAWAPTNASMELAVSGAVESVIVNELSPEDRASLPLNVTVTSERLDV